METIQEKTQASGAKHNEKPRQTSASKHAQFYSQGEFFLFPIVTVYCFTANKYYSS